jgi:hypothetical protein
MSKHNKLKIIDNDEQFVIKKNKSLINKNNTDNLLIKKIINSKNNNTDHNNNDSEEDNDNDNDNDNDDIVISNKKKSSSKKNKNVSTLTLINVNELLDIHIEYVNKLKNFKNKTNCALRFPNFPECISENIIKEYINIIEKRNCSGSTTC